ncbi:MAG: DUF4878 domain-containing protein [Actinobacteria bacterium]|nr:DUF4878 domain-containing protein [Actinomycetota bacterium]MBU1943367.1 DUF4878 domain-containing protein [Actinomycetota bacterium]MBU2686595.1 DUF4878 domain-containing protein [Actinomycetota bacterium]
MRRVMVPLLALILMAGIVAAGCGDGSSSKSGDPEAAVEQFMKSTMAEDADATYELLSSESQKGVENKEDLVEGAGDQIADWNVGEATQEGDTARVEVTMKMKDVEQELTFDVVLAEEGGAWKINLEETGKSMDEAINKLMESSSPQ